MGKELGVENTFHLLLGLDWLGMTRLLLGLMLHRALRLVQLKHRYTHTALGL